MLKANLLADLRGYAPFPVKKPLGTKKKQLGAKQATLSVYGT